MKIDKLYELGKIWSEIKYFSPYLHLNQVDWNEAYCECYSQIKNCHDNEFLDLIDKHLLSKLGDPLARVETPELPKPKDKITNSYKLDNAGLAFLSLNNWSDENVDELINEALDNLPSSTAFVLDIQNFSRETEKNIYSNLYNHQFFDHFRTTRFKRTTDLKIEYEGFPNEVQPENITFYESFYRCSSKPSLTPFKKSAEIPLIIITGQFDPLCEEVHDLRNNNRCRIIAVEDSFVNFSTNNNAVINTSFGKISYSHIIPLFSGYQPPIYSDAVVKNRCEAIADSVKGQLNSFKESAQPSQPLDITCEIQMDRSFNQNTLPSEAERVLAVTKLYAVTKFFYPHKEHMNCDWDEIYKGFLPNAINCNNREEYINLLKEMSSNLNDCHVYLWRYDRKPIFKIPLKALYIDEKIIITEVLNVDFKNKYQVEVGDEITSVNGESIGELIKRKNKTISASRRETYFRDLITEILLGTVDTNFTLTLVNNAGVSRNIRGEYGKYKLSFKSSSANYMLIQELNDNILYVKLYAIGEDETQDLEAKLRQFQNVIFDLRGYPSYPQMLPLLKRLCRSNKLDWGKAKIPVISHNWSSEISKFETYLTMHTQLDATPEFKNNIVVLANANTQSYAESICDTLCLNSEAVFIGSNTAGANGNVTYISLPGNLYLSFTGMVNLDKKGDSMQKVGLKPDIEVIPTLEAIKENRDELIERAVEYFRESESG